MATSLEKDSEASGVAHKRDACTFIRNLGSDLDLPITCISNALALWHAFHSVPEPRSFFEVKCPALLQQKKDEEGKWIHQWKVECASCVLVSIKANEVQRKVKYYDEWIYL